MRFEVRFNNGVYHVFDALRYTAVEAYNGGELERVQERVKLLNAEPRNKRDNS